MTRSHPQGVLRNTRASEAPRLLRWASSSVFEGLEVDQVWVWYALRLVFDLGPPGDPGSYIDVTEFNFMTGERTQHSIDVTADRWRQVLFSLYYTDV